MFGDMADTLKVVLASRFEVNLGDAGGAEEDAVLAVLPARLDGNPLAEEGFGHSETRVR